MILIRDRLTTARSLTLAVAVVDVDAAHTRLSTASSLTPVGGDDDLLTLTEKVANFEGLVIPMLRNEVTCTHVTLNMCAFPY